MQVYELADDLKVTPDSLVALLRHMGIPVTDEDATITDGQMAKVLAKMERERRAGHKKPEDAIRAAMEEAAPAAPRRRRRRRQAGEEEPEQKEEVTAEAEHDEESVADEEEAPESGDADEEIGDEEPVEIEAEDYEGGEEEDEEDEEDEEEPQEEYEGDEEESDDAAAEEEVEIQAESAQDDASDAVEEAHEEESSATRPAPARVGAQDSPVRTIRRPTPAPAASAGPGGQVRIQAEGYTPDGRRQRKEKKKGKKRQGVDQDAVQSNIQRVMAEIKGGGGKKRRKKGRKMSAEEQEAQDQEIQEQEERERRTVRVNEFLTVAELAELVDVTSTEIIGSAFKNLGLLVTINQRLDFDQIELLLDEFNYTAVREEEYVAEAEVEEEEEDPADLKPRSPVVTVMGHVDHGKTLLLDKIRETNVVAGEAGGITQHIGAYHVELPESKKSLTFLDTPGHAAFTAMRARGADVTDIVILLVAADDSVMPQTIEAISHAKNAGVPMIVAINKVDLPAADPDRVKQELLQHTVHVEDFGGDVLAAEVSAKTGQGIGDLLDKVLLQAEMLELQANPDREAVGTVIEAQLDQGKGAVATVLVQKGTLRVGDSFICGLYDGRVKALLDERGHAVEEAGPAIPVQVLGAGGVPQAGDTFQVMSADAAAEIATSRQRLDREKQLRIRERGIKLGLRCACLGRSGLQPPARHQGRRGRLGPGPG
ncbi:MAG: translation initiation factor IF-2 [Gemmatimonadota bacterium]|nr:translation initiation factor IF-2 [Gemmatimonadota bacterium]